MYSYDNLNLKNWIVVRLPYSTDEINWSQEKLIQIVKLTHLFSNLLYLICLSTDKNPLIRTQSL